MTRPRIPFVTRLAAQSLGIVALALVAACERPASEDAPAQAVEISGAAASDDDDLLPARTPLDYAVAQSWLCRPDVADACDTDVDATVIAADGSMTLEEFTGDPDAPVDCFYVHPTVSTDQTPNADAIPGDEERRAAAMQVARFGSVCRIHAPVYRQVTVSALQSLLAGHPTQSDRELAYADIRAAWAHYLANDNGGRGVVLIGHDQGAGLLARLIASEIEGTPAMGRIVAAILPGAALHEAGADGTGGSFSQMAPCVSAEDTGCVIAYAAFRAEAPPQPGALFGAASPGGGRAICVDPAALAGAGPNLNAYLPSQPQSAFLDPGVTWIDGATPPATPMVAVPGLLSASCVTAGDFSWLAVTTHADPADPRTDAIFGDVVIDGAIQPAWGLHFMDMNLALGNLVEVTGNLSKAWASREVSRAQHPEADN